MLQTVRTSNWICHQIFSFAVHSNGSHAHKKEHEAPVILYHIRLALTSANWSITGVIRLLPAGYCKK